MNATTQHPLAAQTAPEVFDAKFFKKFLNKKVRLTFSKEIFLSGMAKASTTVQVRVFENGDLGVLVGKQKRHGHYISSFLYTLNSYGTQIIAAKEVVKKTVKELTLMEKWELVNARVHPNAWQDEMKRDKAAILAGETVYGCFEFARPKFRDITKLFRSWERETEMAKLKDAFDNGKDYSWNRDTNSNGGRDFSIRVTPNTNGVGVRAWFSSEYSGCGNGDYYLLLNPTTAVYYEKD